MNDARAPPRQVSLAERLIERTIFGSRWLLAPFYLHRFAYLKTALALLLVLIGAKIFWGHVFGKVDPGVSLAATLILLGGGVLASLLKSRRATVDNAVV